MLKFELKSENALNRDLLKRRTIQECIYDLALAGLTSTPTIRDHAIKDTSVFRSRLNPAGTGKLRIELNNRLRVAVTIRICTTYRELLTSSRRQRAFSAGAWPQLLPRASTGTKDFKAPEIRYVSHADQSQGQVKGTDASCSPDFEQL